MAVRRIKNHPGSGSGVPVSPIEAATAPRSWRLAI